MESNTVYCLASTEPQANAILTHLRNLGFSSSEISIHMHSRYTRNISVKEDVIQGAARGGIVGGVLGVLITVLLAPPLGPLIVAGPILSALGGAAVGGMVGGLAGGSGTLTPVPVPEDIRPAVEQRVHDGAILIAVHSSDPYRLSRALRVFRSEGADEIFGKENLAA